ncbi:MAG: preprotein translocase subunit SecG [Verrucomicrobia bacterium]|nr:preprotein translocase subunit SecG [Verrucomicrobiota bacterium]
MSFLIGILTFVLVLTCLLLILLVLIQLPKKEAGAGIAFGGAATDALFGAGSGNALTKMTKYTAGFFVALSLCLSLMNSNRSKESNRRLEEELMKKANAPAEVVPPTTGAPLAGLPATASPGESSIEAANLLKTLVSNEVSAAIGTISSNAAPVEAPAPEK